MNSLNGFLLVLLYTLPSGHQIKHSFQQPYDNIVACTLSGEAERAKYVKRYYLDPADKRLSFKCIQIHE